MAGPDSAPTGPARLPWWALPAVLLDRVRPGIADHAAADVAWLRRFPSIIGSVVLPGLAVVVPILFAVNHALAPGFRPISEITFQILDVYTESIPFMIIAAVIGLTAPTLGLLFLTSHMVADLVAAFIQPLELTPLPTAIAGRIVSFWVLYLLVAELPMAVHELARWGGWARARMASGLLRVAFATAAGTFFAGAWGFSATLLVRQVFTWSDLKNTTANAGWPLLSTAIPFTVVVGAAGFVVLALRYLLLPARTEPEPEAATRGPGTLGKLVYGIVLPLALFSSVIHQPVDAVVLLIAVVAARPISVLILRRARLARPLAAIPRTLRLIGGLALSAGVSFLIISVMGMNFPRTMSNFFEMIVAMAVSYVLIRTLLDADGMTSSLADDEPSLAAASGAALTLGVLFWLFGAGPVFADNTLLRPDGWVAPAAAAGAAAGAGGLAAASASQNKKKPNPPPWYIPDSMAEFFGYDPPTPPGDPKKRPDWTKPQPPKDDY